MNDKDSITITWTIDDVKTLRDGITTKQARAVLARVDREYDGNHGITWDTLNNALEKLFPT